LPAFLAILIRMPIPEVPASANKRERILRAAVEVFARTGYFNARVADVAREAGVADGTIYLYFENKDDLLITIFREHVRLFLAGLHEELEGMKGADAKLRRLIRFHLETLGSDRSLAIVSQVELRQSLKFMTEFSNHEIADYFNVIRAIVEEGQVSGAFAHEHHPQLVAKAIFGTLDEMVTSWILSEKDYRLADQAEPVAAFVLSGLT
jgi:TetR/AcrR family fatty acid metabolism transcriptional regulator